MPPFRDAWKNGAAFRAGLIANCDDIAEQLPRFENIEDRLRLLLGNIDPDFFHRFDDERIQGPAFETGALSCEMMAADFV